MLCASSNTPDTQSQPLEAETDTPQLPVRIIPLGGVGEFGLNMMCYECGDERIVVDCGTMFPDIDMLGVDLVIPDVGYLLEAPEKLKAIVLTHAHEDHIGALPYVLSQINAPVYGTPLTLAYLEDKLDEHDLPQQVELRELEYREPIPLGSMFEVEAIHVTHSMPDTACLALHTPSGIIVHTGDYKIDYSPMDGEAFDLYSLTDLGEEGVLALVGDSTNANVPGATKTERWVAENLEPIFANSPSAIFCATFSTSVHRIQLLLDMAVRFGRKAFILGRSLERTFRIASAMGYLKVPHATMCSTEDLPDIPPHQRLILATGSQGEPMSVMARLARDEYRKMAIEEGDTVILSARAIPNNVRTINHMIDHLCRRGARIFDQYSAPVHASGHAYEEEIRAMISMTRPRYLIPVHGERRQLLAHREAAIGMGYNPEDIFILDDGDVLEVENREIEGDYISRASVVDHIETGHVLVDGKTVGETGDVVLRDRRFLSEDGMLIAILNVDKKTGELLTDPEIVTRGFVYVDESEDLIKELTDLVRATFEEIRNESREEADVVNTEIRRALRRHIRKNYERYPLILPVVQEI